MAKHKTLYVCNQCGSESPQWAGQCPDCSAWNSFTELSQVNVKHHQRSGYAGSTLPQVMTLNTLSSSEHPRITTGLAELDRVLGGGLVPGSVILLGGDPGIGKSTILLQMLSQLSAKHKTLYVTGEESLQQVHLRAERLGLANAPVKLLAATLVEQIINAAEQEKPQVMVVDSIQTMYTDSVSSASGSVSQVRESAAQLVQYAKISQTTVFLVGHVTKEGMIAGPRVLEHMVDTVLYFEGQSDNRLRLLRAVKNRFGAVNELGVFAMAEQGLLQVTNPSAIFLSRAPEPVPGSVVMVTWEGTRPILVEVQALVDRSYLPNPRRVTVGIDANRLTMVLAVLHRHGNIATYDQDVFVNVVGGVRVVETAVDLAITLAVLSSLRNQPLPRDLVVFGELGLAGELRPVPSGLERLQEAAKHGFAQAIVPAANVKQYKGGALKVRAATRLSEVLDSI
ncbi:MAG: DNA repair protein RadA [Gammaproteobacteria bacterium]